MLKFSAFIILVIEVLQISAQCIRGPCAARYSPVQQSYAPVQQSYAPVQQSYAPVPQCYPQPCRYSPCMIEQPLICEETALLPLSDIQFPDQAQVPFALGNSLAQTLTSIPAAAGGLLAGFGGILA